MRPDFAIHDHRNRRDIDNSWGESAGDKGIYRLVGNKAKPDGLVIPKLLVAGG